MKNCIYPCPKLPYPGPEDRENIDSKKRVAITGSDGLTVDHWRWFFKMCDRDTFSLHYPLINVWGSTEKIADAYAMNWAAYNWLTTRVYYLGEYRVPRKQAEMERSEDILRNSDFLIIFFKSGDKWADNVMGEAKELSIKTRVHKF